MPAGFRNDFFLAVDVLALQGDTKIFFFTVRPIQIGEKTQLVRKSGSVLSVLRFQC